jgi:cobalt/nickel transport system permease protein
MRVVVSMMQAQESKVLRNWLHRADPGLKLGGTVLLVGLIALLPRRPTLMFVAPALVVMATWLLARMPFLYAARRLLMAQLFIAGIAFFWLFSPGATPLVISVFLKSNLSVIALLVLAWTTPFQEILQVLRKWGVPGVMLTTMALMCRYLPVLSEESRRMQRARASRTFTPSRRFVWQNLSQIIARLFLRSLERAERVYLAMCARGWK